MNIMLVAVLSIAIGLQVLYPLVEGEGLRVITLAIVYWGAGAMLLHALLAFGGRYALIYLSFTFFFATAPIRPHGQHFVVQREESLM